MTILSSGCGSDDASCAALQRQEEVSLIDHAQWQKVAIANDPFAAHLPAEVTCGAGGYNLEGGALEVNTGACNFLTLHQTTRATARRCDELRAVFWHLPLYAGEAGANAMVALHVGSHKVIHDNFFIGPDGAAEKSYLPVKRLEAEIPAGSDVWLHIHNHGTNTWKLLSLTASR